MDYFLQVFCLLFSTSSANLNIDGHIEFGLDGDYKYKIILPSWTQRSTVKAAHTDELPGRNKKETIPTVSTNEPLDNNSEKRIRNRHKKHITYTDAQKFTKSISEELKVIDKSSGDTISQSAMSSQDDSDDSDESVRTTRHKRKHKASWKFTAFETDTTRRHKAKLLKDKHEQTNPEISKENLKKLTGFEMEPNENKKHGRMRSKLEKVQLNILKNVSDAVNSLMDSVKNLTYFNSSQIFNLKNISVPQTVIINGSGVKIVSDKKRFSEFYIPLNVTLKPIQPVRTDTLKHEPHRIKEDHTINQFVDDIYTHTLRIFDEIKEKNKDYAWKKQINSILRMYKDKFTEYTRNIQRQKVKTRLGNQKVILNSVDESNRIVNRLVNMMLHDMENRSTVLRYSHTPNIIYEKLKKDTDWGFQRACSKFNICRSQNGFIRFTLDIMTSVLSVDDVKFRHAIDSFTEAVKYVDLTNAFNTKTDRSMKKWINFIDRQDVRNQKNMVTILRNTLNNRNMPLRLFHDIQPEACKLDETIKLLDVFDILDLKIRANDTNIRKWDDIRTEFKDWEEGRLSNIQPAIKKYVSLFRLAIERIDRKTWDEVFHKSKLF